MDGSTFDRLTRSLGTAGSRRRVLTGLLAGTVGLLNAQTEQAAAKKKCPPCKKRKAGKCKAKKPDGTACAGGSCRSGQCVAATAPPPPGPCDGKADDTACNGDGKCLNGVCNPRPECKASGAGGCNSSNFPSNCCAGPVCSNGVCASNPSGAFAPLPCQGNADCRSRRCIGYRCQCDEGKRLCGNGLCGSCCSDSECTGGQRCLSQADFSHACQCLTDCRGACIPSSCAASCDQPCPVGAEPGEPCCPTSTMTCQPTIDGSLRCRP
jgi:hypothetical protein